MTENPPLLEYAYTHAQTEATTGYFSCEPQGLDEDQALRRLESTPWDDFLHIHCLRLLYAKSLTELRALADQAWAGTRFVRPALAALLLECELDFQQASDSAFLQELELMQPFGAGNAEPVFASPELTVVDRSPLGYSGDHVRLRLKDSASGITLMAKGWNMATAFPPSSVGSRIRVAYTPRLDYYRGVASIDVGIKDWQPVAD